ncbi:esterase/lipase family protein [Candidatus Cardinium sp. cByotN1]|uniref:esterase/lipase family protein n=1 Tax=Candidatus Cardinium sp. cByotN1 TaxID=2699439 RepID=UPI001FB3FA46|nr:hypothetical protein [Candidatus Cardinium sp. cByotN1]
MQIKTITLLKSVLYCFCIGACFKCKPKEEEKGKARLVHNIAESNKAKTSEPHQSQNQDTKEPSQTVSEDRDEPDNLSKYPGDDSIQPKQGLTHEKTTNLEKSDPDVAIEKPNLKSSSAADTPQSSLPEKQKNINQSTHYCVAFHGLTESKDTFYYFEPNLRKALQEVGLTNIAFIYPVAREGFSSVFSLYVGDIFKEIKKQVGDAPVHLIGYSQGGLVAGYLEKKHGDQLNIVSSTYISTPFRGVGAIKATQSEVKKFSRNACEALEKLAKSQDLDSQKINKTMQRNQKLLRCISNWLMRPITRGVSALQPDNNQDLVNYIRKGSLKIPHLIIGSYVSFGDIFDISPQEAKTLDWEYAKLLKKDPFLSPADKNSMKNDTMVPFPSQLARRGSIDDINLAGIKDSGSEIPGPTGCENTTYYVLPKTAHAWNLPIIDGDLYIQKNSLPILASPQVASVVAAFLSKQIRAAY